MFFRLSWLFIISIYLSVNGQVFASPIHLCSAMVISANVLSTSKNAVEIHEHEKLGYMEHQMSKNLTYNLSKSNDMDNCKCLNCDCVQNISGQVNTSLIQNTVPTSSLPVITTILVKLEQNFISQSPTNPYRPPTAA